jgi:hypothetical protein
MLLAAVRPGALILRVPACFPPRPPAEAGLCGEMMLTGKSRCPLPMTAAPLFALSLFCTPCIAESVSSPDTGLANFAFATALGSGVYALSGRTIQVYQIPLSFNLRPARLEESPPGLDFLLPMTVGFFDLRSSDVLHLPIPSHLGAVSLEPGVQLDYWLHPQWHLYPYIKVGVTAASASAVNALIYGFGVRSDYTFDEYGGSGLWRAVLAHAGVHYIGSPVPDDAFTRLRNGAELRRSIGGAIAERRLQVAPYGLLDVYFDAPSGAASGISARTVQFEAGMMLGVMPMWKIAGIELPRLGVGYRVAGELSGWRFVIGDPF